MRTAKPVTITILTLSLLASRGAAQTPRPQAAIEVLLKVFVEAQRAFDVKQIDAILAPDYVEISPVGEVDPRAKVLTFYAPEKRVADAPSATLDDITTRMYGENAITIAKLTYQMKGPDGSAVSRSMRCVFVTRLIDGRWKLVSTQYTPIRS